MIKERLLSCRTLRSLRCARSNDSVALDAKEKGEERVISFNLTVHSLLDLSAYDSYQQGLLVDDSLEVSPEEIQRRMPVVNL